jgi:hypothetical protein
MTAAYLTEAEIIRELRLPRDLGRQLIYAWKIHPTFPQPVVGTNGRRYWPEVEQWLDRLHHVGAKDGPPLVLDPHQGEDFDAWKASKTRRTKKSRIPGPDLAPTQRPLDSVVVATIGPRGKGLSEQRLAAVAPQRDPTPAA